MAETGIKIENTKKVLADIDKLEESVLELLDSIFLGVAYTIQAKAKDEVRIKTGALKNSIFVRDEEERFAYSIGTPLKYGAYMEFGTGDLVEVPPELKEIALEFKAIPEKRRVNIPPKPYLYPALQHGRRYLVEQVSARWDEIKKK